MLSAHVPTPFDQPPGKVSDASFDVSQRKGAGAGTFLFFNLFTLLSRGRKSAKLGPPRSGITAVRHLWLLCTATESTGGRPRKVYYGVLNTLQPPVSMLKNQKGGLANTRPHNRHSCLYHKMGKKELAKC